MKDLELTRKEYVDALDQLMTISCILAGFAFSGLIALPSIDVPLFERIVSRVNGRFNRMFDFSFYVLFFSTLCFLGTIMSILVYRVSGFLIPLAKLRRVNWVSHVIFSMAIATLMVSAITFGMPNLNGLIIGLGTGIGVAGCFIWENMVPWQRRIREAQLEEESRRLGKIHKRETSPQTDSYAPEKISPKSGEKKEALAPPEESSEKKESGEKKEGPTISREEPPQEGSYNL